MVKNKLAPKYIKHLFWDITHNILLLFSQTEQRWKIMGSFFILYNLPRFWNSLPISENKNQSVLSDGIFYRLWVYTLYTYILLFSTRKEISVFSHLWLLNFLFAGHCQYLQQEIAGFWFCNRIRRDYIDYNILHFIPIRTY